jgi:ABC-2 type transport system ATP-binding protein
MTSVNAEGLTFRYGHKVAVDDLSFEVPQGEFHGIIGPNGAGKTTLIELLLGFKTPTSGTVRVLGRPCIPRDPALLRQIGVQPQQAAFFQHATAHEHLTTVAQIFGASARRVDEVIDALNLTGFLTTRTAKLSGGERQKLALASAIVHRPTVLFLDEPTAALDPAARHDLVSLLRGANSDGTTTLYTTHHLDEVERLCDRVTVLEKGRAVATETPAALIAQAGLASRILLPHATADADRLARLDAFESVDVALDGLVIAVRDVSAAFRVLEESGVPTQGMQVRTASLEDSYLALTGKVDAA